MLGLAVAVALVGGVAPAVVAALIGGVALNYLFIEPLHTLTISQPNNAAALLLMVAVAVAVAIVVDHAGTPDHGGHPRTGRGRHPHAARQLGPARRGRAARHGATRSRDLRHDRHRPAGAHRTHRRLARRRVERREPASHRRRRRQRPDLRECGPDARRPGALGAEDTRVLSAVSAQLGTLLEREQLRGEASRARIERARSDIRSSLLAAVSHDLRSPLAGIKACVGTLRATDLELAESDRAELLAGIETSADRLQGLIDNLLDMSRLDAGALVLRTQPVALDEVVPRALAGVPPERVDVDVRVDAADGRRRRRA